MVRGRGTKRSRSLYGNAYSIYRGARSLAQSSLGRAMAPSIQSRRSAFKRYVRPAAAKKVLVRPATRGRARGRMPGNFRGSFKKPRKWRGDAFLKHGAVFTVESGTVSSNQDAVYVGHGFGTYRAMQIVCQAIVRKIFEKHGCTINSMNDRLYGALAGLSPMELRYTYSAGSGGNVVERVIATLSTSTYQDIASTLYTDMMGVPVSLQQQVQFKQLWLSTEANASANEYTKLAVIDLTMLKCVMSFTSSITLQNRTTGATGVGDETSALDVANNPLAGRIYKGTGNGADFRFSNNAIGVGSILADPDTGFIEFDVNGVNVTAEMKEVLQRPPSVSAFTHAVKTSSVRLGPGVLKKGYLKYERTMTFNDFVLMLFPQFAYSLVIGARTKLGSFEMFCFEKMCNTQTLEPTSDVGVELNQTYRCRVIEGKRGISALHYVP